jgi:hypothetical protein
MNAVCDSISSYCLSHLADFSVQIAVIQLILKIQALPLRVNRAVI